MEHSFPEASSSNQRSGSSSSAPSTSGSNGQERCWKTLQSIDGQSWQYTAAVLTTSALALIVLFQERGFLEGRKDSTLFPSVVDLSPAVKEILQSLLLLLFAAFIGVLGFILLKPNLQRSQIDQAQARQARHWVFGAFVALLLANLCTVLNLIGAQKAFAWKQGENMLVSPVSHYFIMVLFSLSMMLTNVLYVRVLLRQILDDDRQTGEISFLSAHQSSRPKRAESGWRGSAVRLLQWMEDIYFKVAKGFMNVARNAASITGSMPSIKDRCTWVSGCDTPVSDRITGVARWIREGCIGKSVSKILKMGSKFRDCGLWANIVEFNREARAAKHPTASKRLLAWKGSLEKWDKMMEFVCSIRPKIEDKCRELWSDIREDEQYSHSAWLKSAVVTAFILIVYFGVLITTAFHDFLNDTYLPRRKCIIENGNYAKFFLSLVGFTDDGYSSIPSSTYAEIEPQLQDRMNRTEPYDADFMYQCESGENYLDPRLAMINVVEELKGNDTSLAFGSSFDAFKGSFLGTFVLSMDIIIRNMDWTVYIGLLVGLVIGSYSLLSVLAQYKRISLAVRAGYFSGLVVDEERQLSGDDRERYLKIGGDVFETNDWSTVVAMYPMSSSMFFFGILVSTAVLQLAVFGVLVSFGLSFVTSIIALYPFIKQFVALLIAFAITWFLNDVFSQWAFGEGVLQTKYKVLRESGFLLFLFVYTMVHLVLGILFALTRLGMLMASSVVWLNRLDKNLYTHNKGLDEGHRSFVATVLLHAAFDVSLPNSQTSQASESNRSSLGSFQSPPTSPAQGSGYYSGGSLTRQTEPLLSRGANQGGSSQDFTALEVQQSVPADFNFGPIDHRLGGAQGSQTVNEWRTDPSENQPERTRSTPHIPWGEMYIFDDADTSHRLLSVPLPRNQNPLELSSTRSMGRRT